MYFSILYRRASIACVRAAMWAVRADSWAAIDARVGSGASDTNIGAGSAGIAYGRACCV